MRGSGARIARRGVAILALLACAEAAEPVTRESGEVVIRIVSRGTTTDYSMIAVAVPLRLVAQGASAPDLSDPLKDVLQRLHKGEAARRSAAKDLPVGTLRKAPRWALASPDGMYKLAGFEDPAFRPMESAVLVRASDGNLVAEARIQGMIRDVRWLPGTRTVLILEVTERWKKSLSGLLRMLVGHPIPMHTTYLTALDADTARAQRYEVAPEVENATVCFLVGP